MTRIRIDYRDEEALERMYEETSRPRPHSVSDGAPCKKRRFRSKEEALKVMHLISSRSDRQKKPRRGYECPKCAGWHLTSQPARSDLIAGANVGRSPVLVDLNAYRLARLARADGGPGPDDDPDPASPAAAIPALPHIHGRNLTGLVA